MKTIKSLVLGSAAGLLAMGGAQAADLPVKAKAVEYVKICSLYGAGFYYIPGTDTCIRLGGYVRVETALNTNNMYIDTGNTGIGGAHNRLSNRYTSRSRLSLDIDTRTATEYGVLRTFFNGPITWTTGTQTLGATGTALTGTGVAGGTIGAYYAFIQFAGFTIGKAVSQFSAPWTNYPGNTFDGLVGGGGAVTGVNQFTYTADFGQGVTAAFSAQDQVAYYQANIWNTSFPGATAATIAGAIPTGVYGTQSIGGAWAPDLVAQLRVDQAWGLFQLSAAAHNNHATYYGATEPTGHPDDKWGWAVQAALSIKNIPTGPGDTINVQAVYTDGASRYNIGDYATTFASYGRTGLAGAYQSLAFAGVADTVFATGTEQQSVKTWGLNGAYTHNWDPHWNTSIYGAYAQVKYGGAGSALVCANIIPLLVAGSTCNPDFNIAYLGLVTRWIPVKNLTFSADITLAHLDQKFSGAIAARALAAIAKPAAVYELKDQNTVSMLIRAQRNF